MEFAHCLIFKMKRYTSVASSASVFRQIKFQDRRSFSFPESSDRLPGSRPSGTKCHQRVAHHSPPSLAVIMSEWGIALHRISAFVNLWLYVFVLTGPFWYMVNTRRLYSEGLVSDFSHCHQCWTGTVLSRWKRFTQTLRISHVNKLTGFRLNDKGQSLSFHHANCPAEVSMHFHTQWIPKA